MVTAADASPGPSVATLDMNENLERFSVRSTSLGATSVAVSGWDDKQQKGTKATSKAAPDSARSRSS